MEGELLGGRYRIRELLGEGGMARVYVAIDEKLGRKVAIKVLHQHFAENKDVRQRFEMEATAISSMDHRNILKVYDFSGRDSEQLWIVTEILKGRNLAQFAQTFPKGALHPIIATCMVRELTKALDHAHGCQLIHRDIKPENVMVLSHGGIKLMDFGIAKNLHTSSVTLTGTFMGSPSYMSPEQVRGRDIDLRSDIYSLGVLFYEIVTGRLPYQGNTTHDVIIKIVEGKFVAPRKIQPHLPVELDKIICKAMSKDAKLRYQISRSFARDLDIFLQRLGFVESHVELERFFTDRKGYEAKLNRRLLNPTQRTKEPNAGHRTQTKERIPKHSKQSQFNTRTQGTKYIDAATVRAHNELAIANPYKRTLAEIEAAKSAVINEPRRDRILHAKLNPYATKQKNSANATFAGQSRVQVQPSPQLSDISQNLQPIPAIALKVPARRRRARQPYPRRTRARQPIHPRPMQYVGSSHSLPLIGFLLVGVLIMLSMLGLWSLSTSIPTNQLPPPKPDLGSEQTQKTVTQPKSRPKAKVESKAISKPSSTPRKPVIEPRGQDRQHAKPKSQARQIPTTPPKATPPTRPAAIPAPMVKTEPRPSKAQTIAEPKATPRPPRIIQEPASIWVSSNVSANILLNGRNIGTTVDATASSGWKEVSAGSHTIELVRPGYETHTASINLDPGERRRLGTITLVPSQAIRLVNLTVQSQQTPVKITIIGDSGIRSEVMNHSPYQISLEEGQYRLKLEYQNKSIERHINVRNQSGPLTISVDFSRI